MTGVIRLPRGVRDFLPPAARVRKQLCDVLLREFSLWGYERLITPSFECADVLDRGLGEQAKKTAIRFALPYTGEQVALRPDMTPQIARIVATRMHPEEHAVRVCYQGAVTRTERSTRSHRQILQAGVEFIGVEGEAADTEVIAVAARVLQAIQVSQPRLELGHVALIQYCLSYAQEKGVVEAYRSAVAKRNKDQLKRVVAGFPAKQRKVCGSIIDFCGRSAEVSKQLQEVPLPKPIRQSIEYTLKVAKDARSLAACDVDLVFDFACVESFDYYTGLRLCAYAGGVGTSILQGGRYDQLLGRFGKDVPAVGFAVDIEASASGLSEQNAFQTTSTSGLLLWSSVDQNSSDVLPLAQGLRTNGLRVSRYMGRASQLDEVLAFAKENQYRAVLQVDAAKLMFVDGTVLGMTEKDWGLLQQGDLAAIYWLLEKLDEPSAMNATTKVHRRAQ